jgi:RNA polymerase sigma-70 factor, ECF subfamily
MTESEKITLPGVAAIVDERVDAGLTTGQLLRDMEGLRLQLTRLTRNADIAADLLQDAIVTALQKLSDGEFVCRRQLDGYVYRVALNHLRNHRRKDKSLVSDPDAAQDLADPDSGCVTESLQSAQWARLAREVLSQVTPPRDRDLLVRFYLHEESKESLCRLFGLSELHFNRVMFRARERFREMLHRRGLGKSDFLSALVLV